MQPVKIWTREALLVADRGGKDAIEAEQIDRSIEKQAKRRKLISTI